MLKNREESMNKSIKEKRRLAKELLNLTSGESFVKKEKKIDTFEIPEKYYKFDKFEEYLQGKEILKNIYATASRNPYFESHSGYNENFITLNGEVYCNYSGFNYLGFSGSPDICEAAKKSIDMYGTSVSASRTVSGDIYLHHELEREIADLTRSDDAVLFVSGYGTNLSAIGHLMRSNDIIFCDSLIHNSIFAGCIQSGARRMVFDHNDPESLDRLMSENRKNYERALVVVEGVYSMDGDICCLEEFIEIKKRHKALIMVDEAHSMGVIGRRGLGIREHLAIDPGDVDIWMGTLSKAFASSGGYIAGSRALIENLKYRAPGCVMFSTGISPANTAAALEAVKKLKREPRHVEMLQDNYTFFLKLMKEKNVNTGLSKGTPIIPVLVPDSELCLKLSQYLFDHKINAHPILYPAVAENEARIRFFITAKHTKEQMIRTVDILCQGIKQLF